MYPDRVLLFRSVKYSYLTRGSRKRDAADVPSEHCAKIKAAKQTIGAPTPTKYRDRGTDGGAGKTQDRSCDDMFSL